MIDAIAFKELYKTVYQDLYRFALCMMHHPQDAEDAVSEAVLSAYENIHKLRKEEAFRSWIFQILANVCRRKLKSRERTETELKEDHALPHTVTDSAQMSSVLFLFSMKTIS